MRVSSVLLLVTTMVAVSGQLTADSGQRTADSGQPIADSGQSAASSPVAGAPARAASSARMAPAVSFDRARFRISSRTFVLDNGLTLVVHEDHAVPIVAVNLWYHVGSRNERPGKTGFAHLFEHFFFNGSEHHPGGFREAMDDLGATNRNGTTNTDRTNFFENVPTSALERTLYLEADRMGFLAGRISQDMLDRERGVVQNEKRQGENQPYGRVFTQVVQAMYPAGHPYSWPTIGSMADLDAAKLEDVREWYRTFYGPNNCVLSLAGDITPERALELVKKYFDGIPPGPPLGRMTDWTPRLDAPIREVLVDRVPQARLYRIYHAPPWRDRALSHLHLLNGVLSGSKSARLDRRLVYEKGVATAVSADVWEKELGSLVILSVTVKPGTDPAVAERELDAVLAEVVTTGVTPQEVVRSRSRLLADFLRGTERLGGFGGRSDILAESVTYGGTADAYLLRLDAAATASAEELRRTARTWLSAPSYTLVVTPFEQLTSGRTSLDRRIVPPLADAQDGRLPTVQRATLSNGARVMLLERHGAPLVNVTLAVDAGMASEPHERAGLSSLALAVLSQGTTSRSAFQIDEALGRVGASVSTRNSLDLSFVKLEALAPHLADSLTVWADIVLNPGFPADLVDLEKRLRLARIAQEKAQPVNAALRVLPSLLYGADHAYGKPLTGSGTEASVGQLARADLLQWHRQWFRPNTSTLVVTGDVTLDAVVPLLERAFRDWRPGTAPSKALGNVTRQTSGARVFVMDRPDAPQSVIVAAHLTEPGGHAADLAIETVMRAFGGIATSRLNRNLRLDKHWSYGVTATLADARGPRPLYVVAPVQADRTKDAMLEVDREIRDIAGGRPIRGDEFASTMRNQLLGLPGRFETLDALDAAAIDLLTFGYADDYFQQYATRVRALDAGALDSAARAFVRPADVMWLVVGDLARIEADVRALGWGPVQRLDADGRAGFSTQ